MLLDTPFSQGVKLLNSSPSAGRKRITCGANLFASSTTKYESVAHIPKSFLFDGDEIQAAQPSILIMRTFSRCKEQQPNVVIGQSQTAEKKCLYEKMITTGL